MTSRWFVALVGAVALQFSGCGETPVEPDTSTLVMPLEVGVRWSYRLTETDATGSVTAEREEVVEVLRDTVIAGERWYVLSRHPLPELWDEGLLNLATNRSDGLWHLYASTAQTSVSGAEAELLFKHPARRGDRFTFLPMNYLGDAVVRATAAPIEVAAGSFAGYHYRIGTETMVEADLYVAPGVGLALMESPLYDFEYNPFRMVRSGTLRVELMKMGSARSDQAAGSTNW